MADIFMNTRLKIDISEVCKNFPAVVAAYLFGSHAKGVVSSLSDVDIGFYFNYALVPSKEIRSALAYDLREALAKALHTGEAIDVVSLNDAPPLLLREVVYKGALVFTEDKAKQVHFESWAIAQWLDWKWYEDQFNKAILDNIGKPILRYAE